MIFHVSRTQHAARIDIFKSGNDFVRRLARRVHHHIQAAAMAHGHNAVDSPEISGGVQDRVEKRNQRCDAFERKTLGAQVASLQNLFEKICAYQALENFFLADRKLGAFDTLLNP